MQIFGYIQKVVGGLLLFVFAISITPKRLLHTAFANHIDARCKKTNEHPYQIALSAYNCDTENLVAESSFDDVQESFSFPVFTSYRGYIFKNVPFSSTTSIYLTLRGPPVNI